MQDLYKELVIAAMKYSDGCCCLLVDGDKHAAVLDTYDNGKLALEQGTVPVYDTEEEAIRALLCRFGVEGYTLPSVEENEESCRVE